MRRNALRNIKKQGIFVESILRRKVVEMGKGKCVAVLVALFMSVFTEWAAGSSGEAELYVEKKNYYVESGRKYINIFYPQIHGIGDGGREECINTIIKDDALKQVREDLSYDLVHGLDYEIKFLDEKLVSIVYEGYYGACGGRLPPTAFATTVDITGEKLLKLKDVVTDLGVLGKCCWKTGLKMSPCGTE